jgi:hypothetical protein
MQRAGYSVAAVSREEVQQLLDRLLSDPVLRAEFARDPEAVAERLGVELGSGESDADRPGPTPRSSRITGGEK